MEKQCRRCHRAKDSCEFATSKVNKDGLHSWCRLCVNEYNRERNKSRLKTPEQKVKAREYARVYRYGITKERYDKMLLEQDNLCAVCKEPFTEALRPTVDHDHRCCPGVVTCGLCVRGLLCSGCNAFAGMIETRYDTHEEMFSYLHLHHNLRWGII